jgi:hypothetical protein
VSRCCRGSTDTPLAHGEDDGWHLDLKGAGCSAVPNIVQDNYAISALDLMGDRSSTYVEVVNPKDDIANEIERAQKSHQSCDYKSEEDDNER